MVNSYRKKSCKKSCKKHVRKSSKHVSRRRGRHSTSTRKRFYGMYTSSGGAASSAGGASNTVTSVVLGGPGPKQAQSQTVVSTAPVIKPIRGKSDIRVKHAVQTLEPALDKINKLRPVSWIYNGDTTNLTHYGFIAQEIKQVLPETVGVHTDKELDKNGNYFHPYTVDQTVIIPFLVKAMQQQQEQINGLRELL